MSSNEKREDRDSCWECCPPGMLVNMVGRLSTDRRRQQRRQIFRVYSVLLIVAMVGIGGGYLLRLAPSASPGGLTCPECGGYMAAYHDGALDAKLAQQVRTHLDVCDYCRQLYETKYSVGRVQATTSLAMSLPDPADGSGFFR